MKRLLFVLVLVAILLATLVGPASAGGRDRFSVCWNAALEGVDVQLQGVFFAGEENITAQVFATTDEEPYYAFMVPITFMTDKSRPGSQWAVFEWPGGDWGAWSPCDPSSPNNLGEVFGPAATYYTTARWITLLE